MSVEPEAPPLPRDSGGEAGDELPDDLPPLDGNVPGASSAGVAAAVGTAPAGLGRVAARGAAVTLTGQAVRIVLQLGSVVVLSRLLDPRTYGLVALVVVVVGIGEIFRDFGLSSAAVQSPTLSVAQRDNLFWINVAFGTGLALTLFLAAPVLARIYRQPEVTPLAHVLCLTFVVNGLATQYRADLERHLRFRLLAISDVSAQAVGLAVALLAALAGAGPWALVAQQLSQVTTVLVLVVIFGRWIPGRPRRGVDLSRFLRFGWHLVGTQLVGYANNNLDTLTIGIRFGPSALGIYNRAFQLLMNPLNQLRNPTTTVALPILSRVRDDYRRANAFVVRGQIAIGYTIVAALALASGAAQPLVHLFLGPGWGGVAHLFSILCVAGVFQLLAFVGYWVYLSRGLTADLFRYTIISFFIKVVCIAVGSIWGVTGVAVGFAVAPGVSWPLSLWWLSRRTPFPVRELCLGAARILPMAVAAGAVTFAIAGALSSRAPVVAIAACGVGGVATYLVGAAVSRRVRGDLRAVAATVALVRSRR